MRARTETIRLGAREWTVRPLTLASCRRSSHSSSRRGAGVEGQCGGRDGDRRDCAAARHR